MSLRSAHQKTLKQAARLLDQQIWCWGRDVLRPERNWLIEVGFDRIAPPETHVDCSSVYRLDLPGGQFVVLRGFGVFYADPLRGGVFLPRYEFEPRYTPHAALDCPPWSKADLPKLDEPTEFQRKRCASLTIDAVDWIRTYEEHVVERLGLEYRRSTLDGWKGAKRSVLPAEAMAPAWQALGVELAEGLEHGSD